MTALRFGAAAPPDVVLIPYEEFVQRRERLQRILTSLEERDAEPADETGVASADGKEKGLDETW